MDRTPLLPSALLAEIEAAAAEEQRPADHVVREAIDLYLQTRRLAVHASSRGPSTPAEAAARMLERRKAHQLPPGTSLRDLMTSGRM